MLIAFHSEEGLIHEGEGSPACLPTCAIHDGRNFISLFSFRSVVSNRLVRS